MRGTEQPGRIWIAPVALVFVALLLVPGGLARSSSGPALKAGGIHDQGTPVRAVTSPAGVEGGFLGERQTPTGFEQPSPAGGPVPGHSAPPVATVSHRAVAAAHASVAPAIPSPVVKSKFVGLNRTQAGGYYPPDPQVAVNKKYVFVLVNEFAEITSKTGSPLSSFSMQSFFGTTSTDNVGDVQVVYDNLSGRWVFSADDFTTNLVYFAVSTTTSPLGSWYSYYFVSYFSGGANSMDQPVLGYSKGILGWDTNQYNSSGGGFVGTLLTYGPKSSLYSGSFSLAVSAYTGYFSIHPARQITTNASGPDLFYWATVSPGFFSGTLTVFALRHVGTTWPITTVSYSIGNFASPPGAVQPGTSSLLDTGDYRVESVGWASQVLWATFTESCTPSGDATSRACLRVDAVGTAGNLLRQDTSIGLAGYYLYYPALTPLHSGVGYMMVLGYSGALTFPSVAVSGQASTDSFGTYRGPTPGFSGSGSDISGRYGDYLGAALDPSNGLQCFGIGEFNEASGDWSTEIVRFTF